MLSMYKVMFTFIFTAILSFIFTELVRYLSFKVGAVDEPNSRRVNKVVMPSSGGFAIYAAYFISILFILPLNQEITIPIFLGATVIIITGLIDDIKGISPGFKVTGIVLATLIVYFLADVQVTSIGIPFIGLVDLGYWSLPMTLLWVTAITNALNLIDGLDGLATGVSSISLVTIGIIAFFFLTSNNIDVTIMVFTLVAACLGFLPANYFPAKIYLGDTGALFLGYMIAVFSLFNLKNVTFISLMVPLVILIIPIADTSFAIIRRTLNKQSISTADNKHIHHQLMNYGFTHKQSVLLLYIISFIFSMVALLYPLANDIGLILLTLGIIIFLQFLSELLGLINNDNKPLITFFKKILNLYNKDYKDKK